MGLSGERIGWSENPSFLFTSSETSGELTGLPEPQFPPLVLRTKVHSGLSVVGVEFRPGLFTELALGE